MNKVLIAAFALCLTGTVFAADRVKIALDVPEVIRDKAFSVMKMKTVEPVAKDQASDYTLCTELDHNENSGSTISVWLGTSGNCKAQVYGKGMSEKWAFVERCALPQCKTRYPNENAVWRMFRIALNRLFVENAIGLGQFSVSQCTAENISADDPPGPRMRIGSRVKWEVELSFRYKLEPQPPQPPDYYYQVTPEGGEVRFVGDDSHKLMRGWRTKYLAALCKSRATLEAIRLVTQFDIRELNPDTVAGSVQAMKSQSTK